MKIGILISGRGSNMVAIVDAVQSGEIPSSEVAVVISDKADAAGLAKARERGVETVVVERNGRKRAEHDAEIISELRKRGVELVCLAGYMRLLSPDFVQAFPNQIINIHPSLLPAFPGLDAQKQAFDAGVETTGCTVHYVDEELDHGPIILQQWVSVENGDTVDSLSERILEIEHKLYVEAIKYLVVENDSFLDKGRQPKYSVLKSLAHNFTHSYGGWNWNEVQEIKKIVREKSDHRLVIDWFTGSVDCVISPKAKSSIEQHRKNLIRSVHQAGAFLWTISEFRAEIYLLPNHQMVVDGVIVDDRGIKHVGRVYDF